MKCTAGEHEFFSGVIVCTHSASTRMAAVQSGIKHFHTPFHGSGSLSGSLGVLPESLKNPLNKDLVFSLLPNKRSFNIIMLNDYRLLFCFVFNFPSLCWEKKGTLRTSCCIWS